MSNTSNNYVSRDDINSVALYRLAHELLCALCGTDLSASRSWEPMVELFDGEVMHVKVCSQCIDSAECDYAESLADEFPEQPTVTECNVTTCNTCGGPLHVTQCRACGTVITDQNSSDEKYYCFACDEITVSLGEFIQCMYCQFSER